jgi:hypothetical protein
MTKTLKFNFKKFGEVIKFQRTGGRNTHDKLYTLDELSELVGITKTTLWRIEHGLNSSPEQFILLAHWAGLNLYDFLENS